MGHHRYIYIVFTCESSFPRFHGKCGCYCVPPPPLSKPRDTFIVDIDTSMRYRKTRRRKRRWKSRNFGRELVLLLLDGTSLERVLDIDLETVIRCRSRNPNKLLTRNECQTTSFSTPFFKGVQPTRNTIKLILSKRIVLIIVLNQFLFKFQEA